MVAGGRYNFDCYTPMQAAHILRLTPARVRQLLQGGALEGERDEAGHWLIPTRVVHERLERLRRESFLEAVGYDPSSVHEMRELVEVLRSQVEMLRTELDEAHAANRENRRIIAALTSRIPEIEATREQVPSREPSGSPETASGPAADGGDAPPATGGPQEGSERPPDTAEWPVRGGLIRPWWRRMFSG
jgi:hypothetical protein